MKIIFYHDSCLFGTNSCTMKEKKKILSLSLFPLIYYPIVLEFCRKKRKRERGGREREREKSKGEKNKKGDIRGAF